MITGFPTNPSSNVGGLAAFRFAAFYSFAGLPAVSAGSVVAPAQFYSGFGWLPGYATADTLQFSETPKQDDNGTGYAWKISGFIPGDEAALSLLMEQMEQVRHLVLVTDRQGITRMVGLRAPLDFSAVYSPGSDANSTRGYSITFSGSSPKRAPVYALS